MPGAIPANPAPAPLTGEICYLFAFDLAYEFKEPPVNRLLGFPVDELNLEASRRAPRNLLVHKLRVVQLPPQAAAGPDGPWSLATTVKLFPIGAVSIALRARFIARSLADLQRYYDHTPGPGSAASVARRLASAIQDELRAHSVRPVEQMMDEEAYTVFCLDGPQRAESGEPVRGEAWLESRRREVAGLLTRESAVRLSRQETLESTSRCLSFYEDDLTVLEWDAALLIDSPAEWAETLHIIELANVQLAELEAYDRLLDASLERSYRDLRQSAFRGRNAVLRELRELRIDMARFQDELTNITKFFGDWALARLYEAVARRFHLSDWRHTVDEKLKTLDDLHEILKADLSGRWMMILEVTVVLLFIIDVAFLLAGVKR